MQEKSKPVDNLRADAEKIITRAIAAVLPDAEPAAGADEEPALPQAASESTSRAASSRHSVFFISFSSL